MKNKFSYVIALLLVHSIFIYGWGEKGHKTITLFAMKLIPQQMYLSEDMKQAIIEHSVDPDKRKRDDRSEGPKHFIDIDYYKEYMDGKIITSLDTLKKLYGEKAVVKEGILPWATENSFFKLIGAFKSGNKNEIILHASDLAHYVEDGHQPLHATVNYNGQLTDQKGIHSRYEIDMVDDSLNAIKNGFLLQNPFYVKDLSGYIFDYIMESNSYVEMLLSADKYSSGKTDGKFNKEYYRLLWLKTKYITINEFNSGALSLASLIYSAWVDAGKPKIPD
ncbi:MAG: hypothetical protein M1495_02905 [Bacteroidetes bacterium]|nr:hypothetical protein [Bacteroidota bacterium]